MLDCVYSPLPTPRLHKMPSSKKTILLTFCFNTHFRFRDLEGLGIYKDITRMCEYVAGWSGMIFQRAQCLNPDTSLGWKKKLIVI
jgi:hypothetical protein